MYNENKSAESELKSTSERRRSNSLVLTSKKLQPIIQNRFTEDSDDEEEESEMLRKMKRMGSHREIKGPPATIVSGYDAAALTSSNTNSGSDSIVRSESDAGTKKDKTYVTDSDISISNGGT
jgi:hypothetical protein